MFRKFFYLIFFIILALSIVALLDYKGVFWHTELFARQYEMKGIDISHHQGLIDWDKLSNEDVSFVFMKATEGTGHVDSYFYYNWSEAENKGIYKGAYHFFSMNATGKDQGEYFKSVVPVNHGNLPPVIDIEVSLSYKRADVLREVGAMSKILETSYGKRPILYMDFNTYFKFFEGEMPGSQIWIREIYIHPNITSNLDWSFWQYSDRGSLAGIYGPVDLDVYTGTKEEFIEAYID